MKVLKKLSFSILAVSFLALAHAEDLSTAGGASIGPKRDRTRVMTKKGRTNKKRKGKKGADLMHKDAGPQEEVTDQREVSQQADRAGKMKVKKEH